MICRCVAPSTDGRRVCSVPGCERIHYARGWCNMHWNRWRKHGTTDLPPRKSRARDLRERILERITVDSNGCWLWPTNRGGGYGIMTVGSYKAGTQRGLATHRVSYEEFVGPIPEGLQIDHLCNVPACCNPDHLEPVTGAENMRRMSERRMVCQSGHPLTAETVATSPNGRKHCLLCRDAYNAVRRQRRAERREAA